MALGRTRRPRPNHTGWSPFSQYYPKASSSVNPLARHGWTSGFCWGDRWPDHVVLIPKARHILARGKLCEAAVGRPLNRSASVCSAQLAAHPPVKPCALARAPVSALRAEDTSWRDGLRKSVHAPDVIDALDKEASVGYYPVGNLDGHQDPGGHLMYFTWAADHRHSAGRCNLANYDVCANAYGVP